MSPPTQEPALFAFRSEYIFGVGRMTFIIAIGPLTDEGLSTNYAWFISAPLDVCGAGSIAAPSLPNEMLVSEDALALEVLEYVRREVDCQLRIQRPHDWTVSGPSILLATDPRVALWSIALDPDQRDRLSILITSEYPLLKRLLGVQYDVRPLRARHSSRLA
jgi:hypothetical protein